ncbi:MAG: MMPL family transporter [Candidatus Omnitrophica bacterium]|nr:MMPL family transporter [Candidatus Omnitrophota bacterium]
MKGFIKWFSHGLIRYRFGFLGLCLIVSLFFAYQLKNLSFKTNLSDFYPLRHPYLKVQDKLTSIFGGLNQVLIAIEVKEGTILNPKTLEKIWYITDDLYLTEGVNAARVISLSARKIKYVEATAEGFLSMRLMHDPPKREEGIEELKRRIIKTPIVYGPIVSRDFKATLIQADFEKTVSVRKIFNLMQELKNKYEDNNHKIYLCGYPLLQGWLDAYLVKMAKLFLLTLFLIALVLYQIFRSKRGLFLPIISASMATLWGLGLMSMFGYKLTPSTVLAPFLVFALGVSHSVQFIKHYYEYMNQYKQNPKAVSIKITKDLFVPAFVGLLTDGIAPSSLLMVPLGIIKSLAVGIGFGILSIFFSTVILVPNLLSFMKPPKRLEVLKEETTTFTNRIMTGFAKLAIKKPLRWMVIISFLLLTFVSLFGIKNIEVGEKRSGTSLLYAKHPYNEAEDFISERFATSDPYYILVEAEKENGLVSVSALKEMDSLQRYLEKNVQGVGRTLSLVEYIKGMNLAMFEGKIQEYRIPEQDATINEYLFLYSLNNFPGDFEPVVSSDYRYANIKIDLLDHKSKTIKEALKKTEAWLNTYHKDNSIRFSYAGGNIGMVAAVNEVTAQMLSLNSFTTAGMVLFCLVVSYGWILGLGILFLPVVFRTTLLLGILGFLKIGLTSEIIPVVALGIGFGDDFGLYIVSRVLEEIKKRGGNLSFALIKAMSTSGKAVFFTGLSLTLGIASWILSPILMQARLGVFLSFLILFNVLGTLVVLPSMMMVLVKPNFLKRYKEV